MVDIFLLTRYHTFSCIVFATYFNIMFVVWLLFDCCFNRDNTAYFVEASGGTKAQF